MKKCLLSFILLLGLVFLLPEQAQAVNIKVQGKAIMLDTQPISVEGRLLVPMRSILEALGTVVEWQPPKTILAQNYNTTIYLNVGSKYASVNNKTIELSPTPQIINGRVLIPLRFVSEQLGADVVWDEDTQTAIVWFASNGYSANSTINYNSLKFDWAFRGYPLHWDYGISGDTARAGLEYYRKLPHPRNNENDFVETYCMNTDDDKVITAIVDIFKDAMEKGGYNINDTAEYVVAFVQAFAYTDDKATTGYDEYPRYPMETILEKQGDCEDTAILTATLLRELGIGAALIFLPGHCAVGVKGTESVHGTYYTVNGSRYYYLETTNKGWPIGEVPKEYKDQKAIVLPLP